MDEVEDKSHRNSKCFKSQDNIELGAPETHTHTHAHTEMCISTKCANTLNIVVPMRCDVH